MTKKELWKQIREYNDEFPWEYVKSMTISELKRYLNDLKESNTITTNITPTSTELKHT